MRFIEVKVYEFEELGTEAQKRAVSDMQSSESYLDHPWYAHIIEQWEEKLIKMGFDKPDIRWDGFHSQGDGASFTAEIDIPKFIAFHKCKTKFKPLVKMYDEGKFNLLVKRIGHLHVHVHTCRVWEGIWGGDYTHPLIPELIKVIEAKRAELCDDIYKDLGDEYEYLTSFKSVSENLIINEYVFLESGEFYNENS
jgi:hypothetical protein